MQQVHNLKILKTRRKTLRNSLGLPEIILWSHLKDGQLGKKFRRQHSIDHYVLDFYCPESKLAVELDGATHDNRESQNHDSKRDTFLRQLGIRVLRIHNKEVLENLEGVLEEIKKWL